MPYLEIKGRRLFYAHRKTSQGLRPLVLIHGAGGSHLDWPAELLRLPGVAVYALDLPGHGRSSPPGYSSVEDYARMVLAFIEATDLEGIVLAGHSMGGAIAQWIGINSPDRLSGLVLLATGARLRVSSAILGSILTDPDAALMTITHYRWASDAPPSLIEAGHETMRQLDPHLLHGDYVACNDFDVMNQVGGIQIPTLVIAGTADRLTPTKYGQYLADCIPGADFCQIEGCGHMLTLERPAEVAAAIASFIGRLKDS